MPTLCLVQVAWLEHVSLGCTGGRDRRDPAGGQADRPARRRRRADGRARSRRIRAPSPTRPARISRCSPARFGVAMPAIVDTQVMAAFAGIGDQVGFAALANELLGLTLGKELQWTDWAARPLSDGPARLRRRRRAPPAGDLRQARRPARRPAGVGARRERGGRGRCGRRGERDARDRVASTSAGCAASTRPTLAAVIELAAWRQRVCIELDRPLGQVLHRQADHRSRAAAAVERLRRSAASRACRGSRASAPARSPRRSPRPGPAWCRRSRPAGRRACARSAGPSCCSRSCSWSPSRSASRARLLATRADAEELARTVDERGLAAADALPALATWRREVIGQRLARLAHRRAGAGRRCRRAARRAATAALIVAQVTTSRPRSRRARGSCLSRCAASSAGEILPRSLPSPFTPGHGSIITRSSSALASSRSIVMPTACGDRVLGRSSPAVPGTGWSLR